MSCGACRFFDCGEYCKCVCHSKFKDTPKIYGEESPKRLKTYREKYEKSRSEEASMEGLSSLFG